MIFQKRARRPASVTSAIATITTTALLGLAGCGGDRPASPGAGSATAAATTPAAPAAPTITLDPTQQQAETALLTQITAGGRFPMAAVKKENARLFLHLAATSTDPRVQSAALLAMPEVFTFAERYTEHRVLIGPEYAQTVLLHIRSATPAVQAGAIRAAKTCILGNVPNAEILAALTDLAANHATPSGRYEAMEILWNASTFHANPTLQAPYVAALDAPEPWMVSIALFRIGHGFARSYADKPALLMKVIALAHHADPGVRGRAADVLTALGETPALRQQAIPLLVGLLDDPSPYVKSEAMTGLALLDHKPSIHRIVGYVDDMTDNTYDIRGFVDLLGNPAMVHHDGSAWSRLADAADNAIRTYSTRTPTPFRYDIDFHQVEPELRRVGREARAWYNAHKAEFPAN